MRKRVEAEGILIVPGSKVGTLTLFCSSWLQ